MSEPVRKPAVMPITLSLDVLYTLIIFYEFTQWHMVSGAANHLLWVLVVSITVIDWLSVRATYDLYSLSMMFIDLTDVFLLINIVPTLFPAPSPFGYDPHFWLYLAALSGLYALWDFMLARTAPVGQRHSRRLVRWGITMIASLVICLATYAAHLWITYIHSSVWWYAYGIWLIDGPAFILWVVSLVIWLLQRLEPSP